MKKIKINLLLSLTFGAFISLVGCTKDDGAIPSRVSIENVPAVSTVRDVVTDTIRVGTQAAFSGKYTIRLYFPQFAPTKIDLVIRKNNTGSTANNANVKLYKANAVTTYPSTLTVTGAEIIALFGALSHNDYYDIAPDMYVGDKKYEAYPLGLTGSGAGVVQMPTFSESARFYVRN